MKFSRHFLVVLSTTLIGATSAGYMEVGCGCDNYNKAVAFELGGKSISHEELSDPAKVVAAIDRRFAGVKIAPENLPGGGGCAYTHGRSIVCTYWLWKKPGSIKALVVTVHYGKSYTYESSRVSYREEEDRSSLGPVGRRG